MTSRYYKDERLFLCFVFLVFDSIYATSIKAKRKRTLEEQVPLQGIHYRQIPVRTDKRIVLPIFTLEDKRVTGEAKYADGLVTLTI
jgi:hypothetical protein